AALQIFPAGDRVTRRGRAAAAGGPAAKHLEPAKIKSMRSVGRGIASDSAEARYVGASQCLRRIDSSPRSCICSSSLVRTGPLGTPAVSGALKERNPQRICPNWWPLLVQMHLKVPEYQLVRGKHATSRLLRFLNVSGSSGPCSDLINNRAFQN
ncbi:hypothetical protein EJB05_13801, partial [Eragrostis curvula]